MSEDHAAEHDLAKNLARTIQSKFPFLECKVTHSFIGRMKLFGHNVAPSRYPFRIKISHIVKPTYKCTLQVRIANNQIFIATYKLWANGIDPNLFYDIKMEQVQVKGKDGLPKSLKDGSPHTRTKRAIYCRLFDLFSPVETERFFTFLRDIFDENADATCIGTNQAASDI